MAETLYYAKGRRCIFKLTKGSKMKHQSSRSNYIFFLALVSSLLFVSTFIQSSSANGVTATVNVGLTTVDVAYDSAKGEIYATNQNAGTVLVINDTTNTVSATIPVGTAPEGVTYDSGKGEIFVTNNDGNKVSVIIDTTNTISATITVGTSPSGIVYDSAKGEVY